MFRLAFSYMHYNTKLIELLEEYVPNCFFAISLNQHNNSFQLEFLNQQAKTELNIEDTKSMIEILRNTYVVNKAQVPIQVDLCQIPVHKSGDISIKKAVVKRQTLEEYSFYKVKQNLSMNQSDIQIIEQLDGIYFDNQKQINNILNIDVKQMNYGKNYLLFVINKEKPQQMMTKSEEQIKYLNKIILYVANQLSASLSQFSNAILSLNYSTFDNEKLQYLKCQNIWIMNQFQNFYYFVNACKINNEISSYKIVNLKQFISNLETYFSFMSSYQNKKFITQFNLEDCNIKINSQFLSQIVVNIFEQCLTQADITTTITLNISTEMNLNPLRQENNNLQEKNSIQEFEFIKKVVMDSEESPMKTDNQKLIKFEFTFFTEKYIELQPTQQLILNPQTFEDYQSNNNQEFLLIYPITNFLLKKIGPYNFVQQFQSAYYDNSPTKQALNLFPSMMDLFQGQNLYQNKLSFYVYSDQTLLTQSFIKYVQQKSFLDS
ncbi:unnamed protein product (macronuclear) [Paramecium tetraurelia]|uniref:Uncharacterized protein n=1 Tax=Paramecium tetraurelia TaxID=5888 RepID=A0DYT8_PARTE|nr:uncharacterized protein GSPATT00003173001 [Paramecium tetraurelia]CAK88205.1 unnamed protein product [Paramecium tetraurelia]|eukprot:XP_001455602.1 hypothetical protein (macronuclear) [Paramecium tetraurelia strain d4-2]